jgi:prepilin-type N-terminal cleavage/methylation domain-containing protein
MRKSNNSAFTLIEVAIAIAVIAILAGAVAPLALKALNQQREQKTRDNVQTAYEAIVGSRSKSVSNMLADFGFVPPATLADLRFMTTINPAAAYRNGPIPLAYGATFQGFIWGWNGPYWTGSTGPNNEPVDGWGRALRWSNNQVQSKGMDGSWGTADDIVFPNSATAPATATLTVTVERQLPPPPPTPTSVTLGVFVYDRNLNVTRTQPIAPLLHPFPGSHAYPFGPYTVQPGPVSITLDEAPPPTGSYTQNQVVTLSPGENRTILFRLNN